MLSIEYLEGKVPLLLDIEKNSDVVSIGFWFNHGSRDETPRQRGFSHFLEHMLFKGTVRRSALEIALAVDRVGGVLNGFTEKELTCYYCTLPREHYKIAIDVLSDMIFNSVFDEKEMEKEKNVIFNEILSQEDSPEEKAYEYYLKGLWEGHSLALRISGETEQVRNLKREDLIQFYGERCSAGNLIVSAAGNFDKQRLAEELLGKIPIKKDSCFRTARTVPGRRHSSQFIKSKFKQVQIYSGIAYLPQIQDYRVYFDEMIFSTIMGESMSSRLFQRIREDLGLCYAISCYRTIFSDVFLWTVYANTADGNVPALLNALYSVLSGAVREPPGRTEIEDAKSHLKGSLILVKSDMEVRMKRLMRLYHLTGRIMEFDESVAMIESVTQDDVFSVCRRFIQQEKYNILAYGGRPVKNLERYDFNN